MLAAEGLLEALSQEESEDTDSCLIKSREDYDLKDVLEFCFGKEVKSENSSLQNKKKFYISIAS